jgi:hypothetical protein
LLLSPDSIPRSKTKLVDHLFFLPNLIVILFSNDWQNRYGALEKPRYGERSFGKTPLRSVAFRCCGLHLAFRVPALAVAPKLRSRILTTTPPKKAAGIRFYYEKGGTASACTVPALAVAPFVKEKDRRNGVRLYKACGALERLRYGEQSFGKTPLRGLNGAARDLLLRRHRMDRIQPHPRHFGHRTQIPVPSTLHNLKDQLFSLYWSW